MKVLNIHERELPTPPSQVGALLDRLASPEDPLWPGALWPRMQLDAPLAVGAAGGHGPIRYLVEEYQAGTRVVFRFTRPGGFDGHHRFEVIPTPGGALLRHTISMEVHGTARLLWLFAIRPLHDALLEDALAFAQRALGPPPELRPWSRRVRLLRFILAKGRPRAQRIAPAASAGERTAGR